MILTTLLISCDYVPRMKLSELYEWDDNLDISQIEKGSYGDKILYAKTTYTGIELTLKNDKYSVTDCDPNATEI